MFDACASMALRGPAGVSSGEVMREDAIPCERITRIFATVAGIGGVFLAWPLCHIHYGQFLLCSRFFFPNLCFSYSGRFVAQGACL